MFSFAAGNQDKNIFDARDYGNKRIFSRRIELSGPVAHSIHTAKGKLVSPTAGCLVQVIAPLPPRPPRPRDARRMLRTQNQHQLLLTVPADKPGVAANGPKYVSRDP